MIPDGTLHHFRTHDNREVDFVIERRDGTLIGIEVKAGMSASADDFSALRVLKEQAGRDFRRGIVLYRGTEIVPFADDMVAMPLSALWDFNVGVTTDRVITPVSNPGPYIFWADYGGRTPIRCIVGGETLRDYFEDRAFGEHAIAAIEKHWHAIWPIFERKIREGGLRIVPSDMKGQHIREVTLEPADFGYRDFRKEK